MLLGIALFVAGGVITVNLITGTVLWIPETPFGQSLLFVWAYARLFVGPGLLIAGLRYFLGKKRSDRILERMINAI
jgi:hypothetical protein